MPEAAPPSADEPTAAEAPLSGMTVLELGDFVSVPYCARLLGDLGATVVKIEPPRRGDSSRYFGPFPPDRVDSQHSGLFALLNQGKRSVTLDVATPTGAELLLRLAADVDVIVEDVLGAEGRSGALKRDDLAGASERALVASLTGYGLVGPLAGRPATSIQLMAASGFSRTVGAPDREPLDLPGQAASFNAGLDAAAAILGAWLARDTGFDVGPVLDLAALDGLAGLHTGTDLISEHLGLPTPQRLGNRQGGGSSWGVTIVLPSADGPVYVFTGIQRQFSKLLAIVNADLGTDARPASGDAEAIEALMRRWLSTKTRDEVLALDLEHSIGLLPVRTTAEAARDMEGTRLVGLSPGHEVTVPGPSIVFERESWPAGGRANAPTLGEANVEILSGRMGVPREDLELMFQTGIV